MDPCTSCPARAERISGQSTGNKGQTWTCLRSDDFTRGPAGLSRMSKVAHRPDALSYSLSMRAARIMRRLHSRGDGVFLERFFKSGQTHSTPKGLDACDAHRKQIKQEASKYKPTPSPCRQQPSQVALPAFQLQEGGEAQLLGPTCQGRMHAACMLHHQLSAASSEHA